MPSNRLSIGKYVIVNNSPILFPSELMHSDVASGGQSAGFFVIRLNTSSVVDVFCWGESTSLHLASDQANDARIIREYIASLCSASILAFAGTAAMEK